MKYTAKHHWKKPSNLPQLDNYIYLSHHFPLTCSESHVIHFVKPKQTTILLGSTWVTCTKKDYCSKCTEDTSSTGLGIRRADLVLDHPMLAYLLMP